MAAWGRRRLVYEIVGVAADAHYTSLKSDPPPTAYYAYQQSPLNRVTFNVRTAGDPTALISTVRETLRQLDDTVPIFDVRTLNEQILRSLTQERLFAGLAILLGGITLALSGIGLYGLLAYGVTRRTPEIGIRIALGAERGQVRWMVLKQSLVLVACGLALGVPAAWASTSIVESLLFGHDAEGSARLCGRRHDDGDRRTRRGLHPGPPRVADRSGDGSSRLSWEMNFPPPHCPKCQRGRRTW